MTTVAQAKQPTRGRTPRKRGDGEGTLHCDAKAKLWRASVMVGMQAVKTPDTKPDSKPVLRPDRRKVSARQQEDCLARLDALRTEPRGPKSRQRTGLGRSQEG